MTKTTKAWRDAWRDSLPNPKRGAEAALIETLDHLDEVLFKVLVEKQQVETTIHTLQTLCEEYESRLATSEPLVETLKELLQQVKPHLLADYERLAEAEHWRASPVYYLLQDIKKALQTKVDPRPRCIQCGRKWTPPEGVDATVTSCRRDLECRGRMFAEVHLPPCGDEDCDICAGDEDEEDKKPEPHANQDDAAQSLLKALWLYGGNVDAGFTKLILAALDHLDPMAAEGIRNGKDISNFVENP